MDGTPGFMRSRRFRTCPAWRTPPFGRSVRTAEKYSSTELLYFSAVRTERPNGGVRHAGQVLKRLDLMNPGVPSIHAPVACSEPVVHLVNCRGGDRVSDEAYEPLTSNRAVENA